MILLPCGRALLEPCCRINFMHQVIATIASADNCLCRSRVTGDHNAAVCRVKAVAISKVPCAMGNGKGVDGNIGVLVNDSRTNFMRVDFVGPGVSMLQSVSSNV